MSGLPENPDREQVLAELERILASSYFRNKERPPQILKYIVEKALAGEKVKEIDIGREVCERPDFDPKIDALVRVAVKDIRDDLGKYYANEGRGNPLRIELPPKTYVPVFTLIPPTVRIISDPPLSPEKPAPVTGASPRPFWRSQLFLAGVIFIAGAALAAYLWFGHDSHCGGSIAITSPAEGTEVRQKEVVRGTRQPKEWFCRCKDYVVVEAVEVGQWYVEGRLLEGTQWSVTADFGDYDTRPGTRFSIFVLSTTADLPRGAVVQSPALIATAKKSPVVGVMRKAP